MIQIQIRRSAFRPLLVFPALAWLTLSAAAHANGLRVWTPRASGATDSLFAVAQRDGRFVAAGAGGSIVISLGGAQWERVPSPTTETLHGLCAGPELFVAVGESGTILTSADAREWTPRVSGTEGRLFSVTYGAGLFVASGLLESEPQFTGLVLTSPDGVNWTTRDSGVHDPLNAVVYGGGKYLAVGHLSATSSTNGLDWARVAVPNYAPVYGLIYGNRRFVSGQIDVYTPRRPFSVSEDGDYWQGIGADTDGAAWGLTFGGGLMAAVGSLTLDLADPTNQVAVSVDGEHWTTYPLGLIPELRAIAYGAGTFVAVGLEGTIVQSGRVTPPRLAVRRTTDAGLVALTLEGDPGCVYQLQVSTNLASGRWSNLLSLTNGTGGAVAALVVVQSQPHQFYRAVLR